MLPQLLRSIQVCPVLLATAAWAAEPAPPTPPGRVVVPPAPVDAAYSGTGQSLVSPAPTAAAHDYGNYSAYASGPMYGTPGGYEARIGSPYHYSDAYGGQFVITGDPYYDHFGPGFHRHSLHGHYRFPYYNYRAPWYYPGRAVYNRDTNFAW